MGHKTKFTKWRYGKIEVFVGDEFIGKSLELYGEWAQNEIDFLTLFIQTGYCNHIIVAGANIGVQTIAFSHIIGPQGKIDSFEVHPDIFKVLHGNVKNQKSKIVQLHNRGLWNENRWISIDSLSKQDTLNYGGFSVELNDLDILEGVDFDIELTTLDAVVSAPCDLLFLDVEGAELKVIQGAKQLIRSYNPLIYTEVRSLEEGVPLYQLLKTFDYHIYLFSPLAYNPDNYKKNPLNIFGPKRELAFFAIPKCRIEQVPELMINFRGLYRIEEYEDLLKEFTKEHYFTSKIYWASEDEGFSEERVQTKYLEQNSTQQSLKFQINDFKEIFKIRFDVYDRVRLLKVDNLKVSHNNTGEKVRVILDLDSPQKINAFCQKKDVHFFEQPNEDIFFLLSENVHFSFQLPELVIGGSIEITVDLFWPDSNKKIHLAEEGIITNLDHEIEKQLRFYRESLKIIEQKVDKVDSIEAQIFQVFQALSRTKKNSDNVEATFKKFVVSQEKKVFDIEKNIDKILFKFEQQKEEILNSIANEVLNNRKTISSIFEEQLKQREKIDQLKPLLIAEKEAFMKHDQIRINSLNESLTQYALQIEDNLKKIQKNQHNIEKSLSNENTFDKLISKMKFNLRTVIPSIPGGFMYFAVRRQIRLIKNNKLFDRDFYLKENPDVLKSKIDPAKHYLLYGAFEGRNPSKHFNSQHYLEMYPDVKKSGMNPLLHFILFGEKELRSVLPQFSVGEGNIQPESKRTSPADSITQAPPDWYDYYTNSNYQNFDPKEDRIESLCQVFNEKLKNNSFSLSISHDNYLKSVGGLQLYMQDETSFLAKQGISTVHIFPRKNLPNDLSILGKELLITININELEIGTFYASELVLAFRKFKNQKKCISIFIHHLMSWDLKVIDYLLYSFPLAEKAFFLHDFFSVCPQYNLLRNDREFCGAPYLESNSCMICKYVEKRKIYHPLISSIIKKHNFNVIAPSELTLNLWQKHSNYENARVIPHVSLVPKINYRLKKNFSIKSKKLRLAFLGHPNPKKGWLIWRKLIDEFDLEKRFVCYHFGSKFYDSKEKFTSVSVSAKDRHQMQKELEKNHIDIVFLWSIMPETFSYTLYESIAAGCFILTHQNSGNIEKTVRIRENGMVLSGEDELYKVLLDEDEKLLQSVKKFQQQEVRYFELVPNLTLQEEIVEKIDNNYD